MSDFGIFAQDQILKVTNDVKRFDRVHRVPCQIGFKDRQSGKWANEWMEVIAFTDLFDVTDKILKGDKVTVSGRVNMREWEGKKSWEILANRIEIAGQGQPTPQGANHETDVPDYGEPPF